MITPVCTIPAGERSTRGARGSARAWEENAMGARARRWSAAVWIAAALGCLATSSPARAQGSPERATELAAAKFEEAREALEKKRYDDACPLFLQSYTFDRTKVGVLHALAECY